MIGVEEMSEQIDWSKAPEWAKKHGLSGAFKSPVWFDDKKYTYVDGQQDGKEFFYADACTYAAKDFSQVAERPTTQSWSGEGLPPVGVVCEANFVGEWKRFEMRYYGEAYVVFKTAFEVQRTRHEFDTCGVKFRTIRTPEQIAADERDKAAHELFRSAWPETHSWGDLSPHWQEAFYRLADSGYRKP